MWLRDRLQLQDARDAITLLRLTDAWARARAAADTHARRRAEEQALGDPLTLAAGDWNNVLQGYYSAVGVRELPDSEMPSKSYVELRRACSGPRGSRTSSPTGGARCAF